MELCSFWEVKKVSSRTQKALYRGSHVKLQVLCDQPVVSLCRFELSYEAVHNKIGRGRKGRGKKNTNVRYQQARQALGLPRGRGLWLRLSLLQEGASKQEDLPKGDMSLPSSSFPLVTSQTEAHMVTYLVFS